MSNWDIAVLTVLSVVGYVLIGVTFAGFTYRKKINWLFFDFGWDLDAYRNDNKIHPGATMGIWPFLIAAMLVIAILYLPVRACFGLFDTIAMGHPMQRWQKYVAGKSSTELSGPEVEKTEVVHR